VALEAVEALATTTTLTPALHYSTPQGRIIHCAGCTMGGGPAARGTPISCQIFNTLFEHSV